MKKIIFKAKARLAAEKWARGLMKLAPAQEKMLLGAINDMD